MISFVVELYLRHYFGLGRLPSCPFVVKQKLSTIRESGRVFGPSVASPRSSRCASVSRGFSQSTLATFSKQCVCIAVLHFSVRATQSMCSYFCENCYKAFLFNCSRNTFLNIPVIIFLPSFYRAAFQSTSSFWSLVFYFLCANTTIDAIMIEPDITAAKFHATLVTCGSILNYADGIIPWYRLPNFLQFFKLDSRSAELSRRSFNDRVIQLAQSAGRVITKRNGGSRARAAIYRYAEPSEVNYVVSDSSCLDLLACVARARFF